MCISHVYVYAINLQKSRLSPPKINYKCFIYVKCRLYSLKTSKMKINIAKFCNFT
uniref:Uncharacterized protein n=1 Tax=Arundo donax TaxID=35708 RepID=A0A0A9B0Q8_ARUDO